MGCGTDSVLLTGYEGVGRDKVATGRLGDLLGERGDGVRLRMWPVAVSSAAEKKSL